MKIFDELENLRREAYVKAILRDDVIGYIGGNIPLDIFYSRGLYAIPVYGIDSEILQFSQEKNLCDLINATVTYAKTDKCPLIHSSKLIVCENFCEIMTREISALNKLNKSVFIYESGQENNLIAQVNNIYGFRKLRDVKELMREINNLIHKLKFYSDLTGLQAYILEYYIKFLELDEQLRVLQEIADSTNFHDEQVNFCPVYVQSGAGIYKQIDEKFSCKNYRIFEDFCSEKNNYNYVFKDCQFYNGEIISYKL